MIVNGVAMPMRLTLGALAELEARLESDSLQSLIERFESGDFRASDLVALLAAGLRAAGWDGDEAELAQADIGDGPIGAAKAAGRLLRLAFSLPER